MASIFQKRTKLLNAMRSTWFVYLVTVLLSFPVAVVVLALISPLFTPLQAEMAARHCQGILDSHGNSKEANSLELSRLMERYNMSWLYITDGSEKPIIETSRFTPHLENYAMRSTEIKLRNTNYYEAVVALKDGYMLHVGMDLTYPGLPLSALEDIFGFWNMPFRGSVVFAMFVLCAAMNFFVLSKIFLVPLSRFSKDIRNLAGSGNLNLVSFDKLKLASMSSSELWSLKGAIHTLIDSLHQQEKERTSGPGTHSAHISGQQKDSYGSHRDGAYKDGPWRQPSERELQEVSGQSLPKVGTAGGRTHRSTVHALRVLQQSEESFGENITEGVIERFPGLVSGVVFMKGDVLDGKSTADSIVKSAGLKESQLVELKSLNLSPLFDQARTAGKAITIGPMSLARTGLDAIMERLNAQHIVMAPLRHRRRYLGFLLVLTKVALGPDQIRALERLLDQTASVYHGLLMSEAKEEKTWTDPLTRLRNRAYLQEVAVDLTNSIGITSGQSYAIVYFSINAETGNTDANLDNYAICTAGALTHLRDSQLVAKIGDPSKIDYIRAQPLEFALIIRGQNETFYEELCLELGRLLETSLRADRNTCHHLVISLGLSIFPFDAMKGEDVLSKAKQAMVLAEHLAKPSEQSAPANSYRVTLSLSKAKHIPPDFKPQRKYIAVKGELGVLDGAEVIQSMASGGRTGILSVDEGDDGRGNQGRSFILLVSDGKPVGAALGGLVGMDALMEFICTFETGSFTFSEKPNLDHEAPSVKRQPMPSLINSLMDAALASDNYGHARQIVKDLKTFVVANYSDAAWQELIRQEEPGEREQYLIKEVMKLADGKHNLEQIFNRLSYAPTALVWHSTALLANHGLLHYVRVR